MDVQDRVEFLIRKLGFNQNSFAKAIGVDASVIAHIIKGRRNKPSFDIMEKILMAFANVDPKWLILGKGDMLFTEKKRVSDDPRSAVLRHIPTIITVDSSGHDNVLLVPYKAQAGYIRGVGDPEYIERLPAFSLPKFKNGIFRAFEVEGYSMLNEEGVGLHPTDYVIGRYVERLDDIRDNRVYILINSAQGLDDIIIKRCYNTIKEYGWLLCKSDNFSGEYPDIHLDPQQIKEVWEWKGFLSSYYPRTSDVYNMVNELTKEVANLKHQLNLLKP